ncbi:MAG: hypothetical protein M1826_000594 [Phylliscum demangeonii]|nr:MAG: hypothetical protein M1826_000594 [Phylliscum demangeonii]
MERFAPAGSMQNDSLRANDPFNGLMLRVDLHRLFDAYHWILYPKGEKGDLGFYFHSFLYAWFVLAAFHYGAFEKLFTPGAQPGTLYRDRDFRLDWQRNTSDDSHFNVQVQINNETEHAALKKWKGRSVTLTLIPVENVWSADEIRAQIRANFLVS